MSDFQEFKSVNIINLHISSRPLVKYKDQFHLEIILNSSKMRNRPNYTCFKAKSIGESHQKPIFDT